MTMPSPFASSIPGAPNPQPRHCLPARAGVGLKPQNLPNIKLNISAITDKDRRDLAFAYEHELDYVALSFVRDARDIKELVDFMLTTQGRKIPIIAKIEKPEAFRHIEGIIAVADAIMVARGDLGVETSPQDVPLMQKAIIRQCNIAGKPVITATQMSPTPFSTGPMR